MREKVAELEERVELLESRAEAHGSHIAKHQRWVRRLSTAVAGLLTVSRVRLGAGLVFKEVKTEDGSEWVPAPVDSALLGGKRFRGTTVGMLAHDSGDDEPYPSRPSSYGLRSASPA